MSFTYLKGSCPVCNGERKDCRQSGDLTFCRGENPSPNFIFRKYDAHGFGIFVEKALQDEQDADRREEYRRERELEKQRRLAEEAAKRAQSLSEEERNREIRKLLEQLTLKPQHRADLKRRGLSDEAIDREMFRSIDPWQKLDQPISSRLAGVNIDGRSLTNAQSGYICPVWSVEGLLIGWQLRLDNADGEGKYRWPSSVSKKRPNAPTAHLPNGELPITFCRPDGTPKGIGLIEGILKPAIAAKLSGYVVIGAAGGQFQVSQNQLKEGLAKLSAELGTNRIVLFPDAGSSSNRQVYDRDRDTISLVQSLDYKVVVADWGQGWDKSQSDYDELLANGGKVKRFIPASEYLAPVTSEELQNGKRLQEQKNERLWNFYKAFTPTHTINQRFFDGAAPESGKITAIKSGLGTGKTQYITNRVANEERGKQINIGYRNSLLLQQAQKWDSYHLDAHNGYQLMKDPDARLSLCWDSLLKLPLETFEGATLILDEASSSIQHLLTSSTCRENRMAILQRLKEIAPSLDRAVALDGNMADWAVSYLSEVLGKPAVKIENRFKGDTPPVFFLEPEKEGSISKTEWEAFSQAVRDSRLPAIATDSKLEAETLVRLLESDGRKGILLSSKTVTEDWARAFLADPDSYIRSNKPEFLIFTPTAESGVDISIQHYFSDMFIAIFGVLGADEAMQISRRVRHPERIIILCAERGLPAKDGDATYHNQLIDSITERVTAEATVLSGKEFADLTKEIIEAQASSPDFLAWCKIQTKKNLERKHLKNFLLKNFETAGFDIQHYPLSTLKSQEHSEAKQLCKDEEAQQIFCAEDISIEEALDIERNFCASWADRCKAIKARLKARLPGIENSSLWNWEFVRRVRFEERDLLSQLEAAWLYTNPDDAEYLQRDKWKQELRTFLPDLSNRWLKLKILEKLGIGKFLDPTRIWTNESPELLELVKACKRKSAANLLGHPGKLSPIRWLNKLLKLIGARLIGKQVREGETRKWIYQFTDESRPANWDELYSFTSARMAEKIASVKMSETLMVSDVECVTDTPINISSTAPSVTKPSPENPRLGWYRQGLERVRCVWQGAFSECQRKLKIFVCMDLNWLEAEALYSDIQFDVEGA